MNILSTSIIYENPLPQLRSRQSAFPSICELSDGTLLSSFTIGEAFESVDSTSYVSRSKDGGKTWSAPIQMFDKSLLHTPISDYCKLTALPDGRVVAFGYAYVRENPDLPLGNPLTGGLLDDFIFYSISEDNGNTWSDMTKVECSWGPHVEASAPIYVLKDGTWISPITGFPAWNGDMTGKMCGRAICSVDQGKSWNDDAVCMEFDTPVTCYEQRMCQLDSGALICIGWNEDTKTGERLENHYTVSYDNGKTWSKPTATGVKGQASSVCALGGERFLALHAVRRDTDRPGVYAYVVDFSEGKWNVVDESVVWEPSFAMSASKSMADIFSFLKFGQPGAILLKDGDIMMSHWCLKDGQYVTVSTRIKL